MARLAVRYGRIVLLLAMLPVAACAAEWAPYATSPLPAKEGVTDAGPRVAVCYNAMWTSQAHVAELAQQQCAANQVVKPLVTDWHVQLCPLLVPARANFVCTKT